MKPSPTAEVKTARTRVSDSSQTGTLRGRLQIVVQRLQVRPLYANVRNACRLLRDVTTAGAAGLRIAVVVLVLVALSLLSVVTTGVTKGLLYTLF